MQPLTSGYANWCSRRHRRPGHTFQGRFKSELIEDESYFWTVSRYIHLNPVRGNARSPITRATGPGRAIRATTAGGGALDGWPTRLCIRPGVASRAATISRGGLPAVRRAGTGEGSGKSLSVRGDGWLLGSETFIERMRSLLSEPRNQDEVPAARQLASLEAAIVLAEVARYYGVDQDCFQVRRSGLLGRDLAAWLVRHHSSATLRELIPWHRRSSYEPDTPARGVPEPSLAHRVSMCKDAKLSCRGNSPDLRLESSR